jgi:hypothetical protein
MPATAMPSATVETAPVESAAMKAASAAVESASVEAASATMQAGCDSRFTCGEKGCHQGQRGKARDCRLGSGRSHR